MSLEIPKLHFDLNLHEAPDSEEEFLQFIKKCRTEFAHISEEDRKSILAKFGFALRVTRQLGEAKRLSIYLPAVILWLILLSLNTLAVKKYLSDELPWPTLSKFILLTCAPSKRFAQKIIRKPKSRHGEIGLSIRNKEKPLLKMIWFGLSKRQDLFKGTAILDFLKKTA